MLSFRACFASAEVELRDKLLEWLPGKLAELNLDGSQFAFAADSDLDATLHRGDETLFCWEMLKPLNLNAAV